MGGDGVGGVNIKGIIRGGGGGGEGGVKILLSNRVFLAVKGTTKECIIN